MIKHDIAAAPAKDMCLFASFFSRNTNIGASIYIEIKDDKIDTTDNMALKAIPNRTRNIANACDVIFDRSGDILEIIPDKHGRVLSDKIYSNLQAWIKLNIQPLVLHWEREIDTVNFCRRYKKLPKKLRQQENIN